MLRNEKNIPKLIAVLGVLGLAMSLSASRAGAANGLTSFSAANFNGRYVCFSVGAAGSASGSVTAVIKYNPSGGGLYTAGTLIASDDAFGGTGSGFCSYNLNTGASFYSVGPHGTGFETLVWTAVSSNESVCPAKGTSFTDQTAFALRNLANNNRVLVDAESSDANLLDTQTAGHTYCLK